MRRGLSHIEVIVSFVLFIGFVGIAVYLFNPIGGGSLASSSLNFVGREISQNVTVDAVIYGIGINSSGSGTIKFENLTQQGANIAAQNYNGGILPASKSGNDVYVSSDNWQATKFIEIISSEGINPPSESPDLDNRVQNPTNQTYQIATTKTAQAISEKYLFALNKSYENNYVKLKKQFNIPQGIDFGFLVVDGSGKIIINSKKQTPSNRAVFASTDQVNLITPEGKIILGKIQIEVW